MSVHPLAIFTSLPICAPIYVLTGCMLRSGAELHFSLTDRNARQELGLDLSSFANIEAMLLPRAGLKK